ncbi:MAG: hypothetical protein LJE62_05440 [Silicimonas sp.]|jgi:hypothetical protein|nr:hypothetical protein [Silicimonas sp.]
MSKLAPVALFAAITAIAGCDEIQGERDSALIGAAVGCAAGYTLVNGRCVEGAVAGAVVGAVSQR